MRAPVSARSVLGSCGRALRATGDRSRAFVRPIVLRLTRRIRRARRLREIRAGKSVLRSPPATINIELSGRCNVWPPCTYCVGKHAPGYEEPAPISAETLEPLFEHLLAAERVNDCTYGEPLMYPGIHTLIDRLGRAGVRFGFTSNGLMLTEKTARLLARHAEHMEMCVSFNAASAATYFAHQGKDFDKLVANVERFVRLCRERRPDAPPPLIISFIVMQSNKHEVLDFLPLARRLGVQGVLYRHLFDLGEGSFETRNFGHHFVYGREMLPWDEHKEIERRVREAARAQDDGLKVFFTWNGQDSFIKGQAEPGVDIPCLFPWKFLSVRPIHGYYTPCVYMKKGIARTDEMSIEQVWNGDVMQGLRRDLASGKVPQYCCEHSDICPLVLEERARKARAGGTIPAEPGAAEPPEAGVRSVHLPVLARA